MKYGQTLHQRSIPEWGSYNVEYNEIKHLIKVRTTRDQAHAISIPGRGNENAALNEFEEELYSELCEQHQRIDLFVASKSGEISRRLVLRARPNKSAITNAVHGITRAGEEIQSLSRFIGAQRLAFQKLLKKYKKWTGSPNLGKRFRQEILSQPTSFSNIDLEPLVAKWAAVLTAVREPFKDGVSLEPECGGRRVNLAPTPPLPPPPPPPPAPTKSKIKIPATRDTSRGENGTTSAGRSGVGTNAAHIHAVAENGSDVDLDTALATFPLGYPAGKATYWIHPDDLVQLQVLLLRHMRIRAVQGKVQTPTSPSPTTSRRSSLTWRSGFGTEERGDETGLVIFDDLKRFAEAQSAATISDVEDREGRAAGKAVASVRWCADSEAVVVAGPSPLDTPESANPSGQSRRGPRMAKLKKKYIAALFDPKQPYAQRRGSDLVAHGTESTESSVHSVEEVRAWLSRYEEVCPLVQVRSKRTRFHGANNSPFRGTWAALDRDIKMEKARLEEVGRIGNLTPPIEEGNLAFTASDDESAEFPYAVLEVRWEGEGEDDLISALDDSHLTERVRGFSIETHAVAVLYKPENMSPPFWLPALEKDIRKVPTSSKPHLRRSSHSGFASLMTADTSASVTSVTDDPNSTFTEAAPESSATSETDLLQSSPRGGVKKKRKRPYQEHPLRRLLDEEGYGTGERYWNEYDDGDEAPGDEPYTIIVNPNEPTGFPGMENVSKLKDIVVAKLQSASTKVMDWLPSSQKPGERQPLLGGYNVNRPLDDTDAEDNFSAERANFSRRYYSTIAEQEAQQILLVKENFLIHTYIACFSVSIFFLVLMYVLTITSRHRFHVSVDLGVIIGVIASLSFAVTGMGVMLVRKTRVGHAQRFIVLTTFGAICVASGVLLALVGSGG
ncbi:hypothetical protein GP486_006283 [Trichoglossum hirsutum]|uniref:SPX domain-containing protein n=1 Tax=Trichoglossum hirsutum TaxID=265104 RepID=A0A9P8IDU9_9PEZI|nr:hypothetical protein GP486_006283 [Trichoglossum hirsutum]